jgi:hypothetical protein
VQVLVVGSVGLRAAATTGVLEGLITAGSTVGDADLVEGRGDGEAPERAE